MSSLRIYTLNLPPEEPAELTIVIALCVTPLVLIYFITGSVCLLTTSPQRLKSEGLYPPGPCIAGGKGDDWPRTRRSNHTG